MRQHGRNAAEAGQEPGSGPSGPVRLHIDAARGIAGDMLLAALLDLGIPPESVLDPLRAALPPFEVSFERVERRSIGARRLRVEPLETEPPHRGIVEIERLLDAAELPDGARERARACFRRLAAAEAEVHGVDPRTVHFHEVGAVDSLVDIIGVCLAVEHLSPTEITCSSLPLGSGSVRSAHGRIPVPAPALSPLLVGVPVHPYAVGREVTTPTGAALAVTLTDRFGEASPGILRATGWGAGEREAPPEDPPNLLRVWTTASNRSDRSPEAGEELVLLETNLDTATGEEAGPWIDALLTAGALDAWITPTIQKKGRPGLLLGALVRPVDVDRTRAVIFRETGSLGVRSRPTHRVALPREISEEVLGGHRVRVKRAWFEGELVSERPEHDDVARIARETGRPLRSVRDEIEGDLRRRREGGRG